MKSKILLIILMFTLLPINCYAYPLIANKPIVSESQAIQCMKDRNASDEFIEMIPYVYNYAEKVGTDPSLTIAMSAIETGYGKSNLFRNNNNPGGIKSRYGWAKFKDLKHGYRYMVDLLATYAGLKNPNSWLFGHSKTTEGLAGMYWTNTSDYGYHGQLTSMIKKMQSYPNVDKTKESPKKKVKKKQNKIYEILNRDKKSKGYELIMNYIRR